MLRTCRRCGDDAEAPADGLPSGWSLAVESRHGDGAAQPLCAACTRANVRSIEARLPEEWWEA